MKRIKRLQNINTFIFILIFFIHQGLNAQRIEMDDIQISNTTFINQNGESIQLSKLIKGKVIAMNFIFTTCTTICPPMGANFGQLIKLMANHIDKDLVIISVSIDPTTDTPERLKTWSERFNQYGEGWTLLTGEKHKIDQLLKELNVFTPQIEDHAPILLIGREGKDNWIRVNGLSHPSEHAELINNFFD